ncbi:protein of unknown function [Spirosomataceae bacterium TFI 002]|nr:protein of unknown function [Spirosomataceae bacterium TFI 002]
MKKTNKLVLLGLMIAAGAGIIAADHIDAPAVQGGTADITDFYAFQGSNASNLVFVANVQGLLSPGATGSAKFDENVLIEFNIDNSGDNVEDLVIQAIPRNGKMYFFGPAKPAATGASSTILTNAAAFASVDITPYGQAAITKTENGMTVFAGPRDDPFFFDFGKFTEIIGGKASSFSPTGTDTFAGSNVLSVVVEVPKSTLGTAETLNTWVEAKKK